MRRLIKLKVNGQEQQIMVEPRQTLLDTLRYDLGLLGVKEGCGNGNCGSCTVLLDGRAVNSCLVFAVEVEDQDITTIEGVVSKGSSTSSTAGLH